MNQFKSQLLAAETTVDNAGQWKGGNSGVEVWIGDRSGSRVNQYEATVKCGLSTEVRARTYSALVKKILKVVADRKLPIS